MTLLLWLIACSSDPAAPTPPPTEPGPALAPAQAQDPHAGLVKTDAPSSHCTSAQTVVFSCEIVERPGHLVSLCATGVITADSGSMDFRFGPLSTPEVSYPQAPAHPNAAFKHSANAPSPDLSSSSWSFEQEGVIYVLSEARMMGEITQELTVRQPDSSSVSWLCKQPATSNFAVLEGL